MHRLLCRSTMVCSVLHEFALMVFLVAIKWHESDV